MNAELDDLAQSLVIGVDSGGRIVPPASTYDNVGFAARDLVTVRVAPLGTILHQLMRLDLIPGDDIGSVYRDLGGSA
jgi:hypothetical protein